MMLKKFSKDAKNQKFQSKLDFSHIRTRHVFHMVDPSPWPLTTSIGALATTLGATAYFHNIQGGWNLLIHGLLLLTMSVSVWFRDIIREGTYEGHHNPTVQKGLILGFQLFLVSEAMLFFSFFWAFFHSSLNPAIAVGCVWPPTAIPVMDAFGLPLANTLILVGSGVTITWSQRAIKLSAKRHVIISLLYTLFLACTFIGIQGYEYATAEFSISDGIYGSCFYMLTGFHGFHVILGTIAIAIALARTTLNHFTTTQHLGFTMAAWYWHFVDIIWILVYASVYVWGNMLGS